MTENYGYHKRHINNGVYGELSKITEEYEELLDAYEQENHVMALVELSDMLGAIEAFIEKRYNLSLDDLIIMKDATKRAFVNGKRTPKEKYAVAAYNHVLNNKTKATTVVSGEYFPI